MNLLPCIANPESTAHRSLVTTMMAAWILIMLPLTASGQIEADFRTPPADTRPWVYWYFMDGNLSREGITADLEAMRDAGIGGAIFLEVDLGMVWCSPWRVDITDAVKHGRNDLEIEVSNLWVNRLIGDADLPPAKQISWTTLNPYKADSQLMESGLLGPVSIQSAVSPQKN